MESCKLHDEQLPQSPTPVTTACQVLISSTIERRPGRCSSIWSAKTTSSDAKIFAQHAFEVAEIAFSAFFAVGDEADGLALKRAGRAAGWPPACFHLIGGIETREVIM